MLHYRKHFLSPGHEWVVFVHGAGGSSSIWYRQVREFRKNFNVLLIDLRGHGDSQPPLLVPFEGEYSFDVLTGEILEAMDDAGVYAAHFVGISLGCILIRILGEQVPDRVKSMILGGAVVRLNLRSRFLVAVGNLVKRFIPFMWLYKLFAWIIMPRERHRESRTLFVSQARKLCQKEFIRWFKLTYGVSPLLRLFEEKELPIPTLYMMGEEDYMFLPPVSQMARRHTRYTRLEVIPESGHVVNVDRPELFNRLSIGFIHGLSPSAA
ncbi:alpha/beta fold hydrolase [Longimicrobium terrae]|uniref:Pimeloyl-ACP methyl ester carboxylesterase n=1 Tax=Longimicrobium terrae TaxID=1639882 RepID=A0A841GYF8_9BACT|nr:alpha/beta hydrolase [Longimicrobium terrae]MBB4636387.1 pimeloyl-ACP methyl ester carboxylesterase [Longimicrobium terrae]MBB6070783.1 pimeloyl-ACP methyl ester carboxylesterase [Longimicrobium terrae]NNC29763.1 alpha/beta hydrolase [Longimicrobium terrae]